MNRSTFALLLACAAVVPVEAQVHSPPRNPPKTDGPLIPQKPQISKPAGVDSLQAASRWRSVRLGVFSSEVYDTNIERNKVDAIPSNGFVFGGAVRYQSAPVRPGITAVYEIARHSYTRSEQFDRISHNLSTVLSRRLTKNLTAETIGEIALKGSSEDRDVGDQYSVLPRLSYRLDPARRLRAYAAYRIRRYDSDSDRDAHNRYVGAELRSNVGRQSRAEVGYRFETNSARAARRSYTRRTYYADLARSFGRDDDLYTELRYRSQRYDKRLIDVNGTTEPRHDHRITPTIEWTHRFGGGFSMIANYNFENRTSNDVDKGYLDHVFALTGRYDW